MLAGIDVSARTLRDLKKFDPETQATIACEACAAENGDVGTALRKAIDERFEKKAKKNGQQCEKAAALRPIWRAQSTPTHIQSVRMPILGTI